jgi:hypothetical protein
MRLPRTQRRNIRCHRSSASTHVSIVCGRSSPHDDGGARPAEQRNVPRKKSRREQLGVGAFSSAHFLISGAATTSGTRSFASSSWQKNHQRNYCRPPPPPPAAAAAAAATTRRPLCQSRLLRLHRMAFPGRSGRWKRSRWHQRQNQRRNVRVTAASREAIATASIAPPAPPALGHDQHQLPRCSRSPRVLRG